MGSTILTCAVIFAAGVVSALPEEHAEPVDGPPSQFGIFDPAISAPLLSRNRPTDVHGVQVVCTGVDSDFHDDPRWSGYPLKLEFPPGTPNQVTEVSVTDGRGRSVLDVRCAGTWLFLGLSPGDYRARVSAHPYLPQDIAFSVPRRGQKSVLVRLRQPVDTAADTDVIGSRRATQFRPQGDGQEQEIPAAVAESSEPSAMEP